MLSCLKKISSRFCARKPYYHF